MTFRSELPLPGGSATALPLHGRIGAALLAFLALIGLLAPAIAPFDPSNFASLEPFAPAFEVISPEGRIAYLGTDELGRDRFSRLLYAVRTTFVMAAAATALPLTLALLLLFWETRAPRPPGPRRFLLLDYGYLLSLWATFPPFLVAFVFVGFALVALSPDLSSNAVLAVLGIALAELLRLGTAPRTRRGIASAAATAFGSAVVIEASLGFVGLSVQPPTPSLGEMIRGSASYLAFDPWTLLVPASVVIVIAFAARIVGQALSASG